MVNKVEQYEIRIILHFGYLCTKALTGLIFAGQNGTKFMSFAKIYWGRLTMVAKKYVLVELRFFCSKHLLQ